MTTYEVYQWAEYSARWVLIDELDTYAEALEYLDALYETSGVSYDDFKIKEVA